MSSQLIEEDHESMTPMTITSIIIAAGANTRLGGIVAPFMKPLILVNGKPLIQHALQHAAEWNTARDIIVASPDNAALLTKVAGNWDDLDWILQPTPAGVVDAIARALNHVKTDWTLILCGDNTFSKIDMKTKWGSLGLFGARKLPAQDSQRFTRYKLREEGGVVFIDAASRDLGDGCWIGPLLLKTSELQRVVPRIAVDGGSVVTMIAACTNDGREIEPLPMTCEDLGVPEEFTKETEK